MEFSKVYKWVISLFILLLIVFSGAYYGYYRLAKASNFNIDGAESIRLNVYPGEDWHTVLERVGGLTTIRYRGDLDKLATYGRTEPKFGSYLIAPNSTTLSLYRVISKGRENPIRLRFNSVRTPDELYEVIGKQLMIGVDSVRLAMTDTVLLAQEGIGDSIFAYHAIPNTYEVYWSISSDKLVRRLCKESKSFWSEGRQEKARAIGISPYEVSILASIVQEESAKIDEYDDIAGLYLNRLRLGMPLQADPTVKYAVGDFTLKRILHVHLKTESPYNTYLVTGLPPTPIRIPSIQAIDGVLNATEHKFLYMCAKEDFSGYHNFAVSYDEHLANAKRYTAALNARGIR
ncbi:endolytic transglycosylase MltG [Porphyromonas sp.]|uniref:endolytic transglycosylase MltG n=1 Tax=Porphyromonas sp. TaxID=1924944 RepID=UPI0026DB4DBE|nr:endolytic transglycosylase MltG [Porphyromonas sp.]MDO4695651.1 endolytic transglycosylase MltG [Porphyromonas sp.]MDO4771620.1 endolytic transglycosylase MltG [Porphyromonas sp.]